MKRPILFLVVLLSFALAANAQLPNKGNAYIGYSYLRLPSFSSGIEGAPAFNSANLNGWNGSAEFKILPWIGGVADFGGNYGTQTVSIICLLPVACVRPQNVSVNDHTFLFGPRASVSLGKFGPFVHGLLGGAHTKTTASVALPGIPPITASGTSTVFATALGGGLDTRIVKGFAWRLQADDVRIAFSGGAQHNLRLTTGLVLRF